MISLNDLLVAEDNKNTEIVPENDDLNGGGTEVLMCCGGAGGRWIPPIDPEKKPMP